MSQRKSGFERKPLDNYVTPRWVTEVIIPHLRVNACHTIWECAAGSGGMVQPLADAGFSIIATDILQGIDFLKEKPRADIDAILTNPPFLQAEAFIKHALEIAPPHALIVMLLRTDYDHAKSRRYLFKDCPQFYKTVKLLSRIVWFEPATASPSQNHSFFLWKMDNNGKPPTTDYGP